MVFNLLLNRCVLPIWYLVPESVCAPQEAFNLFLNRWLSIWYLVPESVALQWYLVPESACALQMAFNLLLNLHVLSIWYLIGPMVWT